MGLEIHCQVTHRKQTSEGKAQLESDHIFFRGAFRLKVMLKDLKSVRAEKGILRLAFDGGPASFAIGEAAEKWAQKILHPPSRLDKLGVKGDARVFLDGSFEPAFLSEMAGREAAPRESGLLFLAADQRTDLEKITCLIRKMLPAAALWVVYPKGRQEIKEGDVLAAGRAAGLLDVKVVSFSLTHTGLKFVIPRAKRKA